MKDGYYTPFWTIPAFAVMACFLLIVLILAALWDVGRWLLSGIWPIEPQHPERPGP